VNFSLDNSVAAFFQHSTSAIDSNNAFDNLMPDKSNGLYEAGLWEFDLHWHIRFFTIILQIEYVEYSFILFL
jgi:hypothetical protein